MDLVDEDDFSVTQAEFIFGVDEDQTFFSSHFRAAFEEGAGVGGHSVELFLGHDALGDGFLARDVFVVSGIGFGGRGDDRFGETLVFHHSFGELDAAEFTHAVFVFTPGASCEIAADNHFQTQAFAAVAHGHHRVGNRNLPVGNDISGSVEKRSCDLIECLPLVGYSFG